MRLLEEVIAVSKADNNEQIDADILQCKEDILRARDIIPSRAKRDEAGSAPPPAAEEEKEGEIPTFDLAEDITAKQRNITAIRRKAPGKKTEPKSRQPQAGPVGYTIGQPTLGQPEQDRIIAEIVARDIERLRRGSTPRAGG